MAPLLRLHALVLLGAVGFSSAAEEVVALTKQTWDRHLSDNRQTLVEFYAPWCGHCKKLAPEFEKAAVTLKGKVSLAKVDATEEKELASKYNVKGFPTIVWFEDAKEHEYDGGRIAETIVEWVNSMTGPPVIEASAPPEPRPDKPTLVLHAESLLPGFEAAAKASRRTAAFYFVKSSPGSVPRLVLSHVGEEPLELQEGAWEQTAITTFLTTNAFPLFGRMDGDTFEKYLEAGKGLVWSLFPTGEGGIEEVERQYRPMMSEVAKKLRGRYFVTYTDTDKFKEALDNMLSVTEFPAIVVQKKAGDKKRFVYRGELREDLISQFIEDVGLGRVSPNLKSEPIPDPVADEGVKVVVGSTLQSEVFTPDRDVMLEVYAPWCGHCKKLEPEYLKLAKKVRTEKFLDLLSIAKIDGTANDSPLDALEWNSFPTIFFVKAGSQEPMTYDGERTAKGLWKFIKKHATRAQEIRDRVERRRASQKKPIEDL